MRILAALALASAALAACASSPTVALGSCPTVSAIVDGYLYGGSSATPVDEVGERFAVVQRQRECVDVIVTVEGEPAPRLGSWLDGDATGLRAGTVLYTAVGHPDGARLLAFDSVRGWVQLDRQSRIR